MRSMLRAAAFIEPCPLLPTARRPAPKDSRDQARCLPADGQARSRGHSVNPPQGQRLVERRVIHDDARKALARAACLVSLRSARGLH